MLLKTLKYTTLLFLLTLATIFIIDSWVKKSTTAQLYDSVENIPKNKVGLLLGTGKFLKSGRVNLYYTFRIEAAAELFKAKKINYILVSGDNGRKGYDEPTSMKEDLIAKGIPEEKIYLDYAGFRTLDSVVRAKEIFGQNNLTIISQPFHNERALFLAQRKGVNGVAYNAKRITGKYGWKVKAREKLARVKMILDLVFGKEPKFLGEKITIT